MHPGVPVPSSSQVCCAILVFSWGICLARVEDALPSSAGGGDVPGAVFTGTPCAFQLWHGIAGGARFDADAVALILRGYEYLVEFPVGSRWEHQTVLS